MNLAYWNAILRAPAPRLRTVGSSNLSGWGDDRMMNAYDAIWEVMHTDDARGLQQEFAALLRLLEATDEALIEAQGDVA